jgi:hypothetical protein
MVGPIITFLGVCALVAIYMAIVHSFLCAAEEPEDKAREEIARRPAQPKENGTRASSPRPMGALAQIRNRLRANAMRSCANETRSAKAAAK